MPCIVLSNFFAQDTLICYLDLPKNTRETEQFLYFQVVNFYLKMIETRNSQQEELPKILCFNTYLFNVMDIEKGYDKIHNISPYANQGNLWDVDLIFMPILKNNHFGLYVSSKQKSSFLHVNKIMCK